MKNLPISEILHLLEPPTDEQLAQSLSHFNETGMIDGNHGLSRKLRVSKGASIKNLIEALQSSPDDFVKQRLCEIFGWRKSITAIPVLLDCLDDPSEAVRNEAADSLRKIGSVKSGSSLLEHLSIESSDTVKLTVILALGAIKYLPSAEYLVNYLRDSNDNLRAFSSQSLGKMKATLFVKDLEEAMKQEENSWVASYMRKAIQSMTD